MELPHVFVLREVILCPGAYHRVESLALASRPTQDRTDHEQPAASSCLSRRACQTSSASSNLVRRSSGRSRARVMGHLPGTHQAGQITGRDSGQTNCSRQAMYLGVDVIRFMG